jgi:hypothetical protein
MTTNQQPGANENTEPAITSQIKELTLQNLSPAKQEDLISSFEAKSAHLNSVTETTKIEPANLDLGSKLLPDSERVSHGTNLNGTSAVVAFEVESKTDDKIKTTTQDNFKLESQFDNAQEKEKSQNSQEMPKIGSELKKEAIQISDAEPQPEPEVIIPAKYEDLTEREKDFIRVFVEGDYANTDNPLPIEVSNEFFKEICPSPSHAKYLKDRLTPLLKLVDLPPVAPIKNQASELEVQYSVPLKDVEDKITWTLQEVSCQKFEKGVPRCSHCVFKQTDNCRFKGIRILAIYNETKKVALTPPRWQEYSNDTISYPLMTISGKTREKKGKKYEAINEVLKIYEEISEYVPKIERENRQSLTDSQKIDYAQYIIANSSSPLKSFLTLQLDLFKHSTIYLKKLTTPGQHQCDQCRMTLLNIYYLGKHCGIELCYECYITSSISNMKTRCIKGSKHTMTDFIPVTIYPKEIFEWLLEKSDEITRSNPLASTEVPSSMFVYNGSDSNLDESQRLFKPYPRGTEEQFKLEGYQSAMQKGIPIVIEDVTKHHYDEFSAEKFSEYYGEVYIEKLQGNSFKPTNTTLSSFFKGFTEYKEGEPKIKPRKIKDWPPFSDFRTLFPSLHSTFLNSLPFKECTHPDGLLNLATYLPEALNPPDLGPKMYIATGREYPDNKGTTPLHLDAADAVNIMTHSYTSGYEFSDSKCAALWHIFDYKDVDKIRAYLKNWNESRELKNRVDYSDYIHDQDIYLTPEMLQELKEQQGVVAYQIYQNPGDAVFIPAGCSHQVLNLSNCIKIATDYISSERTYQCMRVAYEFRRLPIYHLRHDDIVQTQNHIIFSNSKCISKLAQVKDELLDSISAPGTSNKRGTSKESTPSESASKRPRRNKANY